MYAPPPRLLESWPGTDFSAMPSPDLFLSLSLSLSLYLFFFLLEKNKNGLMAPWLVPWVDRLEYVKGGFSFVAALQETKVSTRKKNHGSQTRV